MNHRPRKRFGQNFLVDTSVVEKIVAAINPREEDCMIEIGPGRGALTRALLEAGVDLHVVEIDRDLAANLPRSVPGLAADHIHVGDALKVDFPALVGADPGAPLRVVGNLPYNISTPLLFHLVSFGTAIHDMHFMLQKEVVERIVATPGGRDYGRLSVMCQYHCATNPVLFVPPHAFEPPPKVESAFVRLVPHESPPVDLKDYETFARVVAQAFSQRRKTLRNSLSVLMSAEMIAEAGVDATLRAEALSLEDFAALANIVTTAESATGQ